MTDELKPCPFCGSDNKDIKNIKHRRSDVKCYNCRARGPWRCSTIDWNHRPIEDALRAENARLREEFENFVNAIEHAHFNPYWFTGGKPKADEHVRAQIRKAKQVLKGEV
jgi:hypothetical protein